MTYLIHYYLSHPDATVRYHTSDMMMYIHSDTSYHSCLQARSRAGGLFFLSFQPKDPSRPPDLQDKPPPLNGAIHILSFTIKNVRSPQQPKSNWGALFHNAKDDEALRLTLQDLGYPQPPTLITTDNKYNSGIANKIVKQRRSK